MSKACSPAHSLRSELSARLSACSEQNLGLCGSTPRVDVSERAAHLAILIKTKDYAFWLIPQQI